MTNTYSKIKWWDLMYCLGGFSLDDHLVTSSDRARHLSDDELMLVLNEVFKYTGRVPKGTWSKLGKLLHRNPESLKNSVQYYKNKNK